MATVINGTPSPTSPADTVSPTAAMAAAGKSSNKAVAAQGNRNGDTGRKPSSANAAEGAQRRSVPPKAWQSGMNPITNRSNNVPQQNGAGQQAKPGPRSTGHQDLTAAEKLVHERLLHLLGNFMGLTASVTVRGGDVFTGIFFGASFENQEISYLLKMVQQTKSAEKNDGANGVRDTSLDFVGVGDDHSMSFEGKDIIDLAVEGVSFVAQEKQTNGKNHPPRPLPVIPLTGSGASAGFRTDTDISGNLAFRERELQRWTGSGGEEDPSMSLEDTNGATWDQFKANEKLFGLKTDYDETIYTTALDRTTPKYRQNEARAQRIAKEIEADASTNAHVREERGLATENGEPDEEDKYSGVRRTRADYPPLQSNQPNRYMPPARRPPSGQPTVPGAPVDPAIISSQIARPEASPKRAQDGEEEVAGGTATGAAPPAAAVPPPPPQTQPGVSAPAVKTPEVSPIESKKEVPKEAPPAKAPNATANVETEVLDSFRTFAEKQKSKVADDRQKRVRHEKDIKLNDLKGFSKNFKLHTPVPNDLVPILAKDKKKQDEIMEKARREAEEHSKSPQKTPKASEDVPARTLGDPRRDAARAAPAAAERVDFSAHRQQFPPRGPQASASNRERPHQAPYPLPAPPQGSAGYLSHRLAETQRAHKAGVPVPIPTPLPLQSGHKPPSRPSGNAAYVPSSQASSTVRTPTSATSTKFNVQAIEFRPNPAASTFKPVTNSGNGTSPRGRASTRKTPPAATPSDFFGNKKMLSTSERPSILDYFNPLKRLREKAENDKTKDYTANGGIPYAHATPVTWNLLKDDEEVKSYKDMFEDLPAASSGVSPPASTASPMNVNSGQIHQVPAHGQQHTIPHTPTPHQTPFPGPHQPHMFSVGPGGPHSFEDHRMHGSPSASTYSTPRMHTNFVAYPTAMAPTVQYAYGQPVPPHMVAPGAPQAPNFRQYPNGPQYMPSPGQQLAAPMMVQQGSQGGYLGPQGMAVPHLPIYGPGPAPSYGGPSQPPSGYPSPGRGGAPMMMQQGSYQGQNPSMHPGGQQFAQLYYAQQQPPHMNPMRGYASPQPHYSHSPQQQYHYPPQPTRISSHGYGNHHGTPQPAPVQPGAPGGAPMDGSEAMK